MAVNPTCSYMMRKEYGELVGTPEARQVAAAIMDPCEFLFQLKQEGKFNRDFRTTPELVAYHVPCHLRAQNIGFRSRDLMRLIPGTTVKMVEQCCGHDGTWAMRKEFFPLSLLTGKKAFDQMQAVEAKVMATDCPLAAIHFQQAIGQRPIHPIQVLARAYRADGFPKAINPPEEKSVGPMRPIDVSEIKHIADYEILRPEWRPQMMALKDRRRIRVGEHMTFLFENRDTVRYQIQEMMRIETPAEPREIAHEVETYNELIPGARELSASLLIEYETPAERDVWLPALLGLEHHIWLETGGQRSPARFDDRQISTDRLSSVQYIKFQLSPEQVAAFPQGAKIVIDHPKYPAEQKLTPEQLRELGADLA